MRLYCKLVQKRKLKKKKLHDMVSIPPGKTYLPKEANPHLTEDFQKSPIHPKSWGFPLIYRYLPKNRNF